MQKVVSVIAVLAITMAAAPSPSPSPSPRPAATHKKPAVVHKKAAVVHKKTAAAPAPMASPTSKMSQFPVIVTVVSKPFCNALRTTIGPVVGGLIQDDAIIATSKPLFEDYLKYEADGDSSGGRRDMALMRMENTVTPLVNALADIDKKLNDPQVFRYPPHTADEKRLLDLRDKLEAVEAMQKASLDVVNGFVQSEQLAAIQQVGNDVNNQINGDVTQQQGIPQRATPPPQFQDDPNVIPGLPQNPYTVDPATIPGISLGSNPIRHVIEGLQWTQAQAGAHEVVATKAVMDGVALCGGHAPAAVPSSTP